jgi:hypothetical protein
VKSGRQPHTPHSLMFTVQLAGPIGMLPTSEQLAPVAYLPASVRPATAAATAPTEMRKRTIAHKQTKALSGRLMGSEPSSSHGGVLRWRAGHHRHAGNDKDDGGAHRQRTKTASRLAGVGELAAETIASVLFASSCSRFGPAGQQRRRRQQQLLLVAALVDCS